jgi:hypothetical protein
LRSLVVNGPTFRLLSKAPGTFGIFFVCPLYLTGGVIGLTLPCESLYAPE